MKTIDHIIWRKLQEGAARNSFVKLIFGSKKKH